MGVLQNLIGFATRPFQKNGHAPAPPPDKARDAKRILEDELASSYRPHLPGYGFWSSSNDTPDLQRMLSDVEAMRAHPKVHQPLSYYKSGIANAPLEVEDASSPEAAKWGLKEAQRFWGRHREQAQDCYDYGRGAAELVYTDEDGSLRLSHLNAFAPLDARVLLRGSDYAGVRVQGVRGSSTDLWGPSWLPAKAWWMAHRRRYSRWYGWPQTYAAWRPWRRLAGRDGAEDIMDLGAYRYALMPVIGRYPERDNVPNPRTWGEVDRFLTNRDKMREFVESFKSGAAVAMSSTKDDKNNYVWDLQLLQSVFDIQALLLYTQDLEKSISFGVGVPPELLEASETGSGYSGRAIPLEAFIAVCQGNAEALLEAIMWQVIDPLVRWNFGPDAFVKLKVADMLKARMQPQGGPQQQPGQAQPPPAAGPGPARFAADPKRPSSRISLDSDGGISIRPPGGEGPGAAVANLPARADGRLSDIHDFGEDEYHAAHYKPFDVQNQHAEGGNTGALHVGGKKYFWKGLYLPDAHGEEHASRMAEALGVSAPRVRALRASRAVTEEDHPSGGLGERQLHGILGEWHEHTPMYKVARGGEGALKAAHGKLKKGEADRAALFTYLLDVADRHSGNLGVTPDGRLLSYDHEYSDLGNTSRGDPVRNLRRVLETIHGDGDHSGRRLDPAVLRSFAENEDAIKKALDAVPPAHVFPAQKQRILKRLEVLKELARSEKPAVRDLLAAHHRAFHGPAPAQPARAGDPKLNFLIDLHHKFGDFVRAKGVPYTDFEQKAQEAMARLEEEGMTHGSRMVAEAGNRALQAFQGTGK